MATQWQVSYMKADQMFIFPFIYLVSRWWIVFLDMSVYKMTNYIFKKHYEILCLDILEGYQIMQMLSLLNLQLFHSLTSGSLFNLVPDSFWYDSSTLIPSVFQAQFVHFLPETILQEISVTLNGKMVYQAHKLGTHSHCLCPVSCINFRDGARKYYQTDVLPTALIRHLDLGNV